MHFQIVIHIVLLLFSFIAGQLPLTSPVKNLSLILFPPVKHLEPPFMYERSSANKVLLLLLLCVIIAVFLICFILFLRPHQLGQKPVCYRPRAATYSMSAGKSHIHDSLSGVGEANQS